MALRARPHVLVRVAGPRPARASGSAPAKTWTHQDDALLINVLNKGNVDWNALQVALNASAVEVHDRVTRLYTLQLREESSLLQRQQRVLPATPSAPPAEAEAVSSSAAAASTTATTAATAAASSTASEVANPGATSAGKAASAVTPELVYRLVLDATFNYAAVAAKLGISVQQVRQLFQQHDEQADGDAAPTVTTVPVTPTKLMNGVRQRSPPAHPMMGKEDVDFYRKLGLSSSAADSAATSPPASPSVRVVGTPRAPGVSRTASAASLSQVSVTHDAALPTVSMLARSGSAADVAASPTVVTRSPVQAPAPPSSSGPCGQQNTAGAAVQSTTTDTAGAGAGASAGAAVPSTATDTDSHGDMDFGASSTGSMPSPRHLTLLHDLGSGAAFLPSQPDTPAVTAAPSTNSVQQRGGAAAEAPSATVQQADAAANPTAAAAAAAIGAASPAVVATTASSSAALAASALSSNDGMTDSVTTESMINAYLTMERNGDLDSSVMNASRVSVGQSSRRQSTPGPSQ